MRKMCHDCPHKREHEAGDEIMLVFGLDEDVHRCHNAMQHDCVGHAMQVKNLRLGVYKPEDFSVVKKLYMSKTRR